MVQAKAQANIINVLDFQFQTNMNVRKIITKLKQDINSFFEDSNLTIAQLKKNIKELILQSVIFTGAKQKIVKLLNKMKWYLWFYNHYIIINLIKKGPINGSFFICFKYNLAPNIKKC